MPVAKAERAHLLMLPPFALRRLPFGGLTGLRRKQRYADMTRMTKTRAAPTMMRTARIGVTVNSPILVSALSPVLGLTSFSSAPAAALSLAVNAWITISLLRPFGLKECTETM